MPDRNPTHEPDEPVQPNVIRESVRPNVIREMGGRPDAPAANVLGRGASRDGASLARLPGISGRWSALVLVGLFVASLIVVPLALHRALWLEAETVIAVWFAIWALSLTWLGYSGRSVERDWGPYRSIWERLGHKTRASWSDGLSGMNFGGFDVGGEGCGTAVLVVIGAALILLLLYLTIGWVVPFVATVLYALVRAMLNRVGARATETRGNLPAAVARGVFWAAAYTGPLALAVWAIHVIA